MVVYIFNLVFLQINISLNQFKQYKQKMIQEEQSLIRDTFHYLHSSNQPQKALQKQYYYIRITNIDSVHPQICDNSQYKKLQKKQEDNSEIVFEMSLKKSRTSFKLNKDGKLKGGQKSKLKRQAHIFSFQADQMLTVSLGNFTESQQQNNTLGYAKVLLTPFIVMPETKHTIKVNMVLRNPDLAIQNQIAAIVTLQIYFLLDFKAKLQIIPCFADLTRNIVSIGQMNPGVIFLINNQKQKSFVVSAGGIHPDWQDYCKQIRNQLQKNQMNIEQDKKKQLENKYLFDLQSASHQLKIQVINYPIIGEDARLIGENVIKIQSCSFFLLPEQEYKHSGRDAIKLYYLDKDKKIQDAGSIVLKTKFIYDAKLIRRQIDSQSQQSDGWDGFQAKSDRSKMKQ